MNDKNLNKRIGNRLSKLREEKGETDRKWSRNYVVRHLPKRKKTDGSFGYMTEQGYRRIEFGEVMPTSEDVKALAELFNVSEAYIWCNTDSRNGSDEFRSEIVDHFRFSRETEALCSLLGVVVRPGGWTDIPYWRDTGEEIPPEEWPVKETDDPEVDELIPPHGANVIWRRERLVNVKIGGDSYQIELKKLTSFFEIAKGTALAALKASCSEFDRLKQTDRDPSK